MMDSDDTLKAILSLIGAIVLVVFLVLQCEKEDTEQEKWEAWKTAHDCKVVGYVKGSWNTGVTTDLELAITKEKDKKTWLCDDGKMYTR